MPLTDVTFEDLKAYPQWVCCNTSKVPFSPLTGKGADCTDPSTWGTYDQAYHAWKGQRTWYSGIGFEFLKDQAITGIDLDKCIVDRQMSPFAREVIAQLQSYTEYSPSGTGIHIWVRGSLPANLSPNRKGDGEDRIEMYDHERYFTVTGKHVQGTPETIEERQQELLNLYHRIRERRIQTKQDEPAPYRQKEMPMDEDTAYGLTALHHECLELAHTAEGGRNQQLNNAAYRMGQLIGGNEISRSTVERELTSAAHQAGLEAQEIGRTLKSGLDAGIKVPRTRSRERMAQNEIDGLDNIFILECLEEGEYGDSKLFARQFRGKVLYDHTQQVWYLWAGHYWKEDTIGLIKHLVSGKLASVYLRTTASLNEQASQGKMEGEKMTEILSLKQIKELQKRAFLLRQVARSKNILYFAASHRGMGIQSDRWDRNPWLLALPNGVLDLRTAILRNGQPEDYICTPCPTPWQGLDAPAPRWEQFLNEIFEDRPEQERRELILFLQRLFGYGITGEIREHVFCIFYGEDGRNGKDTIQHTLSSVLGQASAAVLKDVLLSTGRGHSNGSPTPHLSDLQGKRLAWANEPEKGARFHTGMIKELSGGGEIASRGLFEKKVTKFKPSHLLLLLTNHKPHADANDTAFWERLRLITFNMRFVDQPMKPNERKKDATLWTTLEQEASGILAWLVRGCLDWQRQGLATPQSVTKDAARYREEEDTIFLFISECCVIKEGASVKASHLFEAYDDWCKASNVHAMNKTSFGLQLKKKQFEKKSTGKGIIYQGIGLLIEIQKGA